MKATETETAAKTVTAATTTIETTGIIHPLVFVPLDERQPGMAIQGDLLVGKWVGFTYTCDVPQSCLRRRYIVAVVAHTGWWNILI